MDNIKLRKEIGKRIEEIKELHNMTNKEFAEYINTTTQQLSYVIRGERGFSISKLIEISNKTNCPIEYILTGKKTEVDIELKRKIKELKRKNDEIAKKLDEINTYVCK